MLQSRLTFVLLEIRERNKQKHWFLLKATAKLSKPVKNPHCYWENEKTVVWRGFATSFRHVSCKSRANFRQPQRSFIWCAWDLYRMCMECARDVYEMCTESAWDFHEMCIMNSAWDVHECMDAYGACMRCVWTVHEMHWSWMECVWCMGFAWIMRDFNNFKFNNRPPCKKQTWAYCSMFARIYPRKYAESDKASVAFKQTSLFWYKSWISAAKTMFALELGANLMQNSWR